MSVQEGHRTELKAGNSTRYLQAWNMEDCEQNSKR